MAAKIDDCEFWLPPNFLTDDLPLVNNNPNNDAVFKARLPYLASPTESVVESSETESEEEERMAESTRRKTNSPLQLGFPSEIHKIVFGTFSPQSTLCTMESSGKGSSPNGNVSSDANMQKETLDLLRAAAGEVERIKLHEEEKVYGVPRNTVKPSPIGPSFFSQPQQQHSLSYQHSQLAQFELKKMQQFAMHHQKDSVLGYGNSYNYNYNYNNQMVPNRGRNDTVLQGLSSSAWPPLQLQQRAVFLGNPSVKEERNGTGVFLPRVYNNVPSESRKKPAADSFAALVPEKVVHAVKPKVQGVVGGYPQQKKNRINGKSNMENGPVANGVSGQKRNLKKKPQPVNNEIKLPQEWTY